MKTGLYFGSFNPIHNGHLAIANYIAEFTDVNQVWFVVSPENPLKNKSSLLPEHHRLHLVNTAIGDYPRFKASNIEFNLPKPSYTIDTLTYLKDKYPANEFLPIIGSDCLHSFKKWKNYEQLIEQYSFIVYPRPDFDGGEYKNHPKFRFIEAPLMEISSSFLRSALKEKKDVRFFMPEKVFEYIKEMHFYEK